MNPAKYDSRINVPVTKQMRGFMEALSKRQDSNVAEVTRQAIREYLDIQEDLITSRSRLGRTVIGHLQGIRGELVGQLNHMSALLLAAVILQQVQRGESGAQVMEQIVQLASQIEDHLPEATR
jgi:predicted DNA-binding protein